MDRTLQRSLVGSTAAHGGLLILVVMLSTLAARKIIQPEIPVLELIPTNLRLTMGTQIGGGTPNPRPLAKTEGTPPPAPVSQPPPAQVQPSPPQMVEKVVEKVVEKPVVPRVKVTPETTTVAKAQDVDLSKKADKPVAATPPKVRVNTKKMTRTISKLTDTEVVSKDDENGKEDTLVRIKDKKEEKKD